MERLCCRVCDTCATQSRNILKETDLPTTQAQIQAVLRCKSGSRECFHCRPRSTKQRRETPRRRPRSAKTRRETSSERKTASRESSESSLEPLFICSSACQERTKKSSGRFRWLARPPSPTGPAQRSSAAPAGAAPRPHSLPAGNTHTVSHPWIRRRRPHSDAS